jgi:SAM-dependent methyltransferase
VVASDIDTAYIKELKAPCLEVRRIDVWQDALEEDCYDLVVARALLHRLKSARKALERTVAALKPGGVLLSIEPDMLPCTVAEPEMMNAFWRGWLKWSFEAGIDFYIGRKLRRGWIRWACRMWPARGTRLNLMVRPIGRDIGWKH